MKRLAIRFAFTISKSVIKHWLENDSPDNIRRIFDKNPELIKTLVEVRGMCFDIVDVYPDAVIYSDMSDDTLATATKINPEVIFCFNNPTPTYIKKLKIHPRLLKTFLYTNYPNYYEVAKTIISKKHYWHMLKYVNLDYLTDEQVHKLYTIFVENNEIAEDFNLLNSDRISSEQYFDLFWEIFAQDTKNLKYIDLRLLSSSDRKEFRYLAIQDDVLAVKYFAKKQSTRVKMIKNAFRKVVPKIEKKL